MCKHPATDFEMSIFHIPFVLFSKELPTYCIILTMLVAGLEKEEESLFIGCK